jgi:hypothetical protein
LQIARSVEKAVGGVGLGATGYWGRSLLLFVESNCSGEKDGRGMVLIKLAAKGMQARF